MNRKPASREINAASSINDCVRLVTAFSDVEDMKNTAPSYYPKFYSRPANRSEEIAQRRVVSFWNAWAPRHGRRGRAFVWKPPVTSQGAAS